MSKELKVTAGRIQVWLESGLEVRGPIENGGSYVPASIADDLLLALVELREAEAACLLEEPDDEAQQRWYKARSEADAIITRAQT